LLSLTRYTKTELAETTVRSIVVASGVITFLQLTLTSEQVRADPILGVDVADYIILYEGGSSGAQLSINNFNGAWTGDIGIAGNGKLAATGPGTLNGNINFATSNSGQASISNTTINGTINYGVSGVQTSMTNLNTLSANLGAKNAEGTPLVIDTHTPANHIQTVLATGGTSESINSVNYRLFSVGSVTTNNGENFIIQGDGSQSVVFDVNIAGAQQGTANFHGNVLLEDLSGRFFGAAGYSGLSPDQVLFNLYQGANLVGGDTLSDNNNGNNAHPANDIYGAFLDPNGPISFVNTRFVGRVFGGDSVNMQIVSGDSMTVPPPGGNHNTLTPEPASLVSLFGLGVMGVVAVGWRTRKCSKSATSPTVTS
jgi:hypothetical protein